MLDITVGILSYNRLEYLKEAVASVLAQTQMPTRIAIYDNGSDPSVFAGISAAFGSSIEWIGAEKNNTVVWNFQRAMQDCKTKYVMLLHDDDRLAKDCLEIQTQLLESDLDIIAASSNGYLIDENGKGNGRTLWSVKKGRVSEIFSCSGQVAIRYAKNSCIPFSPTIYRRNLAIAIELRGNFQKVIDAVYFCDLADVGKIVCQDIPLYECRTHSGQDSSYFSYDLRNRLEEFFCTRTGLDEIGRAQLLRLLRIQHAGRNLRYAIAGLRRLNLSLVIQMFIDKQFKLSAMVIFIYLRITNYLRSSD